MIRLLIRLRYFKYLDKTKIITYLSKQINFSNFNSIYMSMQKPCKVQGMNIFVKNLAGKTLTFKVKPSDTIGQLKQKIQESEGVNVSQQRLIISGRHLNEDNDIAIMNSIILQYGDCSTLHLLLRLRGGGFPTILFNNMNQPVVRMIVDFGPIWLTIDQGLNLDGVCQNSKCMAFNQTVCVRKGFGKFNMTMEVYKSPCPMCGDFCKDVTNMFLYLARCESIGKVQGEKDERIMRYVQDKRQQCLTFEDGDENIVNWLYLEMEVAPL